MYSNRKSCKDCIPYETKIMPDGLAKAYVPFQKFCSVLCPEEALVKGTVFPELASPYCGKPGNCKCNKKCQ